ncbi:MAG TPA: DoxX family protein [Flavobacterium sp.]|jgi:uncharacterized membrane protein YphA (DoxX/SURF4 family)
MNTFLWICQVFLAFAFGYSGVMKSFQNREYLVSIGQTGVDGLPYWVIRFIGVAEILGTAGLVLPWATQILPLLTSISALCLAVIMIPAGVIHYKRKEYKTVLAINVTFFILSLFVAYMRFLQVS